MAEKFTYKKLFTSNFIMQTLKKDKTYVFEKLKSLHLDDSCFSTDMRSMFENIYKKVFLNYRYEYIFKNELLKTYYEDILNNERKLLYELELFFHNETINILDILLVSENELHAVEIKSDFDTLQRLDHQLDTYCKLFQFVSVFVSHHKVSYCKDYIKDLGFDTVGIISLDIDKIETIKPPKSNLDLLSRELLVENIKKRMFFEDRDCFSLEDIYNFWLVLLNKDVFIDYRFLRQMPPSLKFYAYSHSSMRELKKCRLLKNFSKN